MQTSDSTLRSAAPVSGAIDLLEAEQASLVLAGATLVELDPPRLATGDVLVRGATIAQVGGAMPEGVPRVDLGGCMLTPAFAVAHTHLYMSLTCGMPAPSSWTTHVTVPASVCALTVTRPLAAYLKALPSRF